MDYVRDWTRSPNEKAVGNPAVVLSRENDVPQSDETHGGEYAVPPVRRPTIPRILIGEPLIQFLLIGALLFAAVTWWRADHSRYEINLGPPVIADLTRTYTQQFGAPPTAPQLAALKDAYIRQEIQFREGVELGLDRDDEIVRRRVAQKYAFLSEDTDGSPAPDAETLEDYFEKRATRYARPARIGFRQIFYSSDRGEAQAQALAQTAAAALAAGRSPPAADTFPGPASPGALEPDQVERLFGVSQFSGELAQAPPGRWVGPWRSGYGWHLVYVDTIEPGGIPQLAEVRSAVLADYRAAGREQRAAEQYRALRARYRIIGDERP